MRRRFVKSNLKAPGLTGEGDLKLADLSTAEVSGIQCVAVECVDILRNTSGEGGLLDRN